MFSKTHKKDINNVAVLRVDLCNNFMYEIKSFRVTFKVDMQNRKQRFEEKKTLVIIANLLNLVYVEKKFAEYFCFMFQFHFTELL
jgi:hypothetical protein